MTGKDVVQYLRQHIGGMHDSNAMISVAWLRQLLTDLDHRMPEIGEEYKLGCSMRLEDHKSMLAQTLESYKATLDYAKVSLNTLFLLNSGAAGAVLTLVGQPGRPASVVAGLSWSVGCFVVGASLAAMALGMTFLGQGNYTNQSYVPEKGAVGDRWRWLSIGTACAGYIAFFVGAVFAAINLTP